MTTSYVPPDAAAWIRSVVLPKAYVDGIPDPSLCACQWGPCGHCQAGQHEQCNVVGWGGAPRAHGDTYITTSRGQVAVGKGVASAEVWLSGRPCRWVCPCGCTPVGPERPPADVPATYQLDLFAMLSPNRSAV
ncbi:hypothetical protein E1211_17940 [Micromonospora sp. 15K316]|uniref:DUF6248 family natural product biosynthesis protein n=1 Tax=Micromonospora sp. 15K316 TaxID=2530376 RepID=UPI001047DEF2|nr:DUF6248 family natural product biosynthesis protein [Micromonospora sp. 15K316]TDC34228.1 hypothetical protein E1211_17940 [Micromonospora sp. 15K316]